MRLVTAMMTAPAAATLAPAQGTPAKAPAFAKPLSPPVAVSTAAPALAGYTRAGWPYAVSALPIMKEVFAKRP